MPPPDFRFPNLCCPELCVVVGVVYDRNYYFGLGPIAKPKPKLAVFSADTVTNTKTIFQKKNLVTNSVGYFFL